LEIKVLMLWKKIFVKECTWYRTWFIVGDLIGAEVCCVTFMERKRGHSNHTRMLALIRVERVTFYTLLYERERDRDDENKKKKRIHECFVRVWALPLETNWHLASWIFVLSSLYRMDIKLAYVECWENVNIFLIIKEWHVNDIKDILARIFGTLDWNNFFLHE